MLIVQLTSVDKRLTNLIEVKAKVEETVKVLRANIQKKERHIIKLLIK